MAKVLVTGASGFVGSHLAEALLKRGDEVDCLVRKTSDVGRLRPLDVRLVYGDVTDPDSLTDAVAGNQVVYHMAGLNMALNAASFHRVNEQGVRNVARACAERTTPPVLVVISSLAAAGPVVDGRPRTEADPPSPVSNYGRSKLAGERAAEEFADRVPTTIVRPPIVLGEADRQGLEMFHMIGRLGIHLVPGFGRSEFSLIHVADLVEALILAAERGKRLAQVPQQSGTTTDSVPLLRRSSADRNLSEKHCFCEAVAHGGETCGQEPDQEADGDSLRHGIYFAACDEHPTYAELGRMIATALGRRRVAVVPSLPRAAWVVASVNELIGRIRRRPLYLCIDKTREIRAGSWLCCTEAARTDLGFSVTVPLAERLRQTAIWYRKEGWV